MANSGLHAELTSLKLANGGRGATVSGRTTYKMLDGIELTTDGADLGADLELLGRSWPGSVPVAQLKADRRLLLQVYGSRGLELGVQPAAAVMPGDRPLVGEYTRTRARIDGRLASLRHTILSLDDPLSRRAVSLMDGTMTRAASPRAHQPAGSTARRAPRTRRAARRTRPGKPLPGITDYTEVPEENAAWGSPPGIPVEPSAGPRVSSAVDMEPRAAVEK